MIVLKSVCKAAFIALALSLVIRGELSSTESNRFEKSSIVPAATITNSEATEILVLGTVHLRSYGDDFDPTTLEHLLDVLAEFQPDMIGIENSAPYVIRDMVNSDVEYEEVRKQFSRRDIELGRNAQNILSLEWSEANDELEGLLDTMSVWENTDDASKLRRRLALLFMATYDYYSALLQLSYLPESERVEPGETSEALLDTLVGSLDSPNESVSIGLALASRLGQQRLYPIDDHRDKEQFLKVADRLNAAMGQNEFVRTQPWKSFYDSMITTQKNAYGESDLLPFYKFLNSEYSVRRHFKTQWQLLFEANIDDNLGRTRVAYFEVRNLSIVANIRRALALHPGKKMLVIIGAGHKGFLDAYLNEMMDVRVVQLESLLISH
jgi:hypothetical protein